MPNHCSHCVLWTNRRFESLNGSGQNEAASLIYELSMWYTYNCITTDDI